MRSTILNGPFIFHNQEFQGYRLKWLAENSYLKDRNFMFSPNMTSPKTSIQIDNHELKTESKNFRLKHALVRTPRTSQDFYELRGQLDLVKSFPSSTKIGDLRPIKTYIKTLSIFYQYLFRRICSG